MVGLSVPLGAAVASRALVLVLQALASNVVSDYDRSTDLFFSSCQSPAVSFVFEGLAKWDSMFFLRIAELGGYEHEKMLAFFPGYPLMIRLVGGVLTAASNVCQRHALLIAGVIISHVAFVVACWAMHALSLKMLGSERLARTATLLFAFNPASIFFSAVYTESLFAALLLLGMLCCTQKRYWISATFFSAAGFVRSNGIVAGGFLAHAFLAECFTARRVVWGRLAVLCIQLAVVTLPFALFQLYGYYELCHLAKTPRPFCAHSLPLAYSFIQREYWNQGFLRYYELKQIPNFLLASPILFIAVCGCFVYVRGRRDLLASLDAWDRAQVGRYSGFLRSQVFPHIACLLALTLVALTTMHVQVATRFLCSSCPCLFWFLASVIEVEATAASSRGRATTAILLYFFVYICIGSLLFSTFLPWT